MQPFMRATEFFRVRAAVLRGVRTEPCRLACGVLVATRQDAEEELVLLRRLIEGVVQRDAATGQTKRWMKLAWLTHEIGMAFLLPPAISWTKCNRCS